MPNIALLRCQHDALEEYAADLLGETERFADHGDGYAISIKLSRFLSHLRAHLRQEDRYLYPRMMAHEQHAVAQTARRFFDEMGRLAADMERFAETYRTSREIQADYPGFRQALYRLIGLLAERIKRENNELFPLAARTVDRGRDQAA